MSDKKEEDNPFSFKTFVSVKERKTPTQSKDTPSVDVDDIFDLNIGNGNNISSSTASKHDKFKDTSPPGTGNEASKKTKPKENPFSFKKFLSGSNSTSTNKSAVPPILSQKNARTNLDPLVSPHFVDLPAIKDNTKNVSCKTSSVDLLKEDGGGFRLLDSGLPSNANDEVYFDIEDEGAAASFLENDLPNLANDMTLSDPSISSTLPDFLSDGAALSASAIGATSMTSSTHDDLLCQIRKLQEENLQLRRDLATERQRCSDKNQRLSQLKIDMERQKKKEAEETKVMEKAVMNVEENLATTTQRAVKAEALVVKLKQELKTLQHQMKLVNAENTALQSGDSGLKDIRERTKYTADELLSASAIAERNIKELSAGVEKLKLLSQVLSSLERVSEVKTDPSPETEDKVP